METWCFPTVVSYVGVCKIPERIRKFQLSLQDGEQQIGEISNSGWGIPYMEDQGSV